MTALTRAKEYLSTLDGDGRTRHAGHPDVLLAELVGEIEAAPTVKVRGKVGEFAAIYVSHSLTGKRVRLVVVGERDV